jgi:hypothetical protein
VCARSRSKNSDRAAICDCAEFLIFSQDVLRPSVRYVPPVHLPTMPSAPTPREAILSIRIECTITTPEELVLFESRAAAGRSMQTGGYAGSR